MSMTTISDMLNETVFGEPWVDEVHDQHGMLGLPRELDQVFSAAPHVTAASSVTHLCCILYVCMHVPQLYVCMYRKKTAF